MATRISRIEGQSRIPVLTVKNGLEQWVLDGDFRAIFAYPSRLGGHHVSAYRGEVDNKGKRIGFGMVIDDVMVALGEKGELIMNGGGGIKYAVVFEAEPEKLVEGRRSER